MDVSRLGDGRWGGSAGLACGQEGAEAQLRYDSITQMQIQLQMRGSNTLVSRSKRSARMMGTNNSRSKVIHFCFVGSC